ncbi:MAG: ribonuclease P protein component 4 [Thermoplasmata archaeon]
MNRGRRGRRTSVMVRIARERVAALFVLAEAEGRPGGDLALGDRYVRLARRVGTRYTVRIAPEYRERFCRSCSSLWVEGRTVRTRLREGRRVRTCLVCGRIRRTPLDARPGSGPTPPGLLVSSTAVVPVEETADEMVDSEESEEE